MRNIGVLQSTSQSPSQSQQQQQPRAGVSLPFPEANLDALQMMNEIIEIDEANEDEHLVPINDNDDEFNSSNEEDVILNESSSPADEQMIKQMREKGILSSPVHKKRRTKADFDYIYNECNDPTKKRFMPKVIGSRDALTEIDSLVLIY